MNIKHTLEDYLFRHGLENDFCRIEPEFRRYSQLCLLFQQFYNTHTYNNAQL